MSRTFEDGAPNWIPPCNNAMYTAEIAACQWQIAAGILPELPNGFCLVFDPVEHDDPYFSGFISEVQYTTHIAMRQAILALPHTSVHSHDVTHIPSYQRMFSHASYADLAQRAAFNSLGDPDLCLTFADAHDHFADQMLLLYRDDGYESATSPARARGYLHTLIDLAFRGIGYDEETLRVLHAAKFDELATAFELPEYQRWYDAFYDRAPGF